MDNKCHTEVDVYFQNITSLLSCQTLLFRFLYFHYGKWIKKSREWDVLQANNKLVQPEGCSEALVYFNIRVFEQLPGSGSLTHELQSDRNPSSRRCSCSSLVLTAVKPLSPVNLHSREGRHMEGKQGENVCPCVTLLVSESAWQRGPWAVLGRG